HSPLAQPGVGAPCLPICDPPSRRPHTDVKAHSWHSPPAFRSPRFSLTIVGPLVLPCRTRSITVGKSAPTDRSTRRFSGPPDRDASSDVGHRRARSTAGRVLRSSSPCTPHPPQLC